MYVSKFEGILLNFKYIYWKLVLCFLQFLVCSFVALKLCSFCSFMVFNTSHMQSINQFFTHNLLLNLE